jgi:charged multivesicular body protein 6
MGCFHAKNSEDPPSRVNENDKVIAELKMTRDKVKNYLKNLEHMISTCQSCVKDCIRLKQKDKAMLALRKQKYLQKSLEQGRNELLNLEGQILSVENALIQKDVYNALKQGNDFLKNMNKALTVEDVNKLMEETQEAIEYQQEVGRILAQQGIEENDEELLNQLEVLDVEEAQEFQLPSVPNRELKKKHKKHKKEENDEPKEVIENYA